MTGLELLALLVFGHCVADYHMQSAFMATGKDRTRPIPGTPWYQVLLAHAVMHGGMVAAAIVLAALSGYSALFALALPLALIEVVLHFMIDDWKCRTGAKHRESKADESVSVDAYNIDQFMHFGCKLLWAGACVCWAGLPLLTR
jgi:Protein of unknown function (DUF3307).